MRRIRSSSIAETRSSPASIALRAAATLAPEGHRPASFSCQYLSVGAFGPAQADVRAVEALLSRYFDGTAATVQGALAADPLFAGEQVQVFEVARLDALEGENGHGVVLEREEHSRVLALLARYHFA